MRTRATLSVVLASGLLLATSGCTFTAKIATLEIYDPSDGVNEQIGDVALLNAMGVTGDGEDVSLVFGALNSGDDDVTLTLTHAGEAGQVSQEVSVPAGDYVAFGDEEQPQVVFRDIDVVPGSLLDVYVQYGSEEGTLVRMPVLDGALEEYAGLVPQPAPAPEVPVEAPTPEGGDGTNVGESNIGEGGDGAPTDGTTGDGTATEGTTTEGDGTTEGTTAP